MGSVGPYLYICGGSDDTSRLDTVERYDPYNDVWVHSEPMSSSRNGVGVCGGDGRIYAIGGLNMFYTIFAHRRTRGGGGGIVKVPYLFRNVL